MYITGEGRLWVSAAEGFFLISGLLVGYVRAYKEAGKPFGILAKNLLKRAGMLYVWGVLITFLVVVLTALLPGDGSMLPKLPDSDQVGSLWSYLWHVMSTTYQSDWIYFLRLYAIVLAATPLFLWLIRKNLWWLAALISIGLYSASLLLGIDEASMQWQVFFFGAALIGWKLEAILGWLRARPRVRTGLLTGIITLTLSTMVLSYFMVHGWGVVEREGATISRDAYVSVRAAVDPLFSNNPMVPLRVLLAFVWFGGLLALFHVLKTHIQRYLGWLLFPFGQASLTVYCLQAIVLAFIVTLVPLTSNFWLNGLVGTITLVLFAGLLRIPFVRRVFPR